MNMLFLAEFERLALRRITRYLPLAVAGLMATGIGIAFFNIDTAPGVTGLVGDGDSFLAIIAQRLGIITFVIGASFIGADAKAGVIEQLLTWEPRRHRLVSARILSIFVASVAIAVVLLSFFSILWLLLNASQGGTLDLNGEFWRAWGGVVGRSAIVAGLLGMLGVAAAILANSAVGPIVGFFIWAFVLEPLMAAFWQFGAPYLLLQNAGGVVNGTGVFGTIEAELSGDAPHHSAWWALVIVCGYVALAAAASLFVFQRRDID